MHAGNNIGDDGAKEISEALMHNETVMIINLASENELFFVYKSSWLIARYGGFFFYFREWHQQSRSDFDLRSVEDEQDIDDNLFEQ